MLQVALVLTSRPEATLKRSLTKHETLKAENMLSKSKPRTIATEQLHDQRVAELSLLELDL